MSTIKKILVLLLVSAQISSFGVTGVFATEANSSAIPASPLDITQYTQKQLSSTVSPAAFYLFYFEIVGEAVPTSAQYIQLKFKNIAPNTPLYRALQKGVYLNFIQNKEVNLPLKGTIKEDTLAKAIKENFGLSYEYYFKRDLTLKNMLETLRDLQAYLLTETANGSGSNSDYSITKIANFPILQDAFDKLKNDYLSGGILRDEDLISGAVKGMTDAADDAHTVYFPPVDNTTFLNQLNGELEGIGTVVEMKKPGELTVVSPVPGSPAEKAGIKAGDIITAVDDTIVTNQMTSNDITQKIKGKAGTSVKITVKRNNATLVFTLIREKIRVEQVDWKRLDNNDFYIHISTFGDTCASKFYEAVDALNKESGINKIIIDLRNNPGGNLDQVSKMLNAFVPKGSPVVHIEYRGVNLDTNSEGYEKYSFANKKIVILMNKGSASASEIMAGSIKDYIPSAQIVGTKSYGKGSVQSLFNSEDGSSIKITVAKWYTGKTHTGIDGIGFVPDKIVELDETKAVAGIDSQLEYAKSLSL